MTHKFRFDFPVLPLVLTALVCMSIGCNKKPTDAQLATTVQKQIGADPALAAQPISVAVNDGTVTLTGTVSDTNARNLASKDASTVEGVRTVVNDLTTASAAGPGGGEAPAAGQPGQGTPGAPSAPASTPAAGAPAPPQPIVIPTGAKIRVRLSQALSTKTNHTGDPFSGTVVDAVKVNGQTAIPASMRARGVVTDAKAQGHIKGQAELSIRLDSVTVNGQSYPVQTSPVERVAKGKGKRSAVMTGGGAGAGALIGGLAGGGKGALIGGLVGGGAGVAGSALTGNTDLVLPAESIVTFVLQRSVTINPQAP